MALTRKYLRALGIEDDKIEEIISAHLETVNPLKDERDSYKDKAEKTDELQKQVDELTAEGSGGVGIPHDDHCRVVTGQRADDLRNAHLVQRRAGSRATRSPQTPQARPEAPPSGELRCFS